MVKATNVVKASNMRQKQKQEHEVGPGKRVMNYPGSSGADEGTAVETSKQASEIDPCENCCKVCGSVWEVPGAAHSPTYAERANSLRRKLGVRCNHFTNTVSIMSNTAMA